MMPILPDNLLIDGENQVKLADFGVATRALATESKLTAHGPSVGSVHYMAPEQAAAADELDVRTDIYALGASFYELLSARPHFEGAGPAMILARKMAQQAPPLRSRRADLPAALAECIDGLLATEPSGRPQSPDLLLEQLAQIVAHEQLDLELVAEQYSYPSGVTTRHG